MKHRPTLWLVLLLCLALAACALPGSSARPPAKAAAGSGRGSAPVGRRQTLPELLLARLATARPEELRLECERTGPAGLEVRRTPALLQELHSAFAAAQFTRLEGQPHVVTLRHQDIELGLSGKKHLDVFLTLYPRRTAPDQVFLWLANGDVSAWYTTSPEAFAAIHQVVERALYRPVATLTPTPVLLQPPQGHSVFPQQVLQVGEILLLCGGDGAESWVEGYRPADGSRLFSLAFPEGVERLAPALPRQPAGFRVFLRQAVYDYDLQGNELGRLTLPAAAQARMGENPWRGFDEREGLLSVAGEEGVYLYDQAGRETLLLPNTRLPALLSEEEASPIYGEGPCYVFPRLLCGGQIVAAQVQQPSAMNPFLRLCLCPVEEGEPHLFGRPFPLGFGIAYPDDRTVVLKEGWRITRFSLPGLAQEALWEPHDPRVLSEEFPGLTTGYRQFYYHQRELGADGYPLHTLYRRAPGEAAQPLLTAHGCERFFPVSLTPGYLLFGYEDSGGDRLALLPLPGQ